MDLCVLTAGFSHSTALDQSHSHSYTFYISPLSPVSLQWYPLIGSPLIHCSGTTSTFFIIKKLVSSGLGDFSCITSFLISFPWLFLFPQSGILQKTLSLEINAALPLTFCQSFGIFAVVFDFPTTFFGLAF